ncbi:RNA 2',3'-cyclic phosphodiesterase, partial [Patescibacteria group bacterium]|nr:RNA 2',3'-cyclic phosphodiesterase [Patescibacteria group bacterium]
MLQRIFLAINIPLEIKKELLEYKKKWPELPARWTVQDNLHITLVFLGNTSAGELKNVKEITHKVAANHEPFTLSLSQITYGPTEKQPKMIWAIGKAPEELHSLQQDLAKTLNHQEENSFSLHVTLARLNAWEFKKIEPEERPHIEEEISLKIPVHTIDIMESRLKRTGPEYHIIERIP